MYTPRPRRAYGQNCGLTRVNSAKHALRISVFIACIELSRRHARIVPTTVVSLTSVYEAGCRGRLVSPTSLPLGFLFASRNHLPVTIGRVWEGRKPKKTDGST